MALPAGTYDGMILYDRNKFYRWLDAASCWVLASADDMRPVLHWKLQETAGTVCNDSGIASISGAYTNTPTLGAAGPSDKVIKSVGFASASTEYVEIEDIDIDWSNGVSITAWLNHTTLAQNAPVVQIGNGLGAGNDYILLGHNDVTGRGGFYVYADGSDQNVIVDAADAYGTGTWYFAVGQTNGVAGEAKYWINGTLRKTGSVHVPGNINRTVNRIGEVIGFYMNGNLADIRVYNRYICEQEISLIYNGGLGTLEQGFIV